MARLYADENFPQPAVERLRELGHDVQTAQDAGKAQQKLPDEAVLADAWADGRAGERSRLRQACISFFGRKEHAGHLESTRHSDG